MRSRRGILALPSADPLSDNSLQATTGLLAPQQLPRWRGRQPSLPSSAPSLELYALTLTGSARDAASPVRQNKGDRVQRYAIPVPPHAPIKGPAPIERGRHQSTWY